MRSWVFLLPLAVSCRSGSTPLPEAGVDVRAPDVAVIRDAIAAPLAVDFTVSDCPSFDFTDDAGTMPRCRGRAPLTVQFVPVTTGAVTKYLWEFGDGTESSSARTAVHTYAFPGSYDVRLVGGGAPGSAERTRVGYVIVLDNRTGDPCDVDQQCESGLACVCGSTAKCNAAFARGLCASACADTTCRTGEKCADLSQGAPVAAEPWQKPLCVRSCQTGAECAPPLRCRNLPGRTAAESWFSGCFPDYPVAPGGRCRGASGQLQGEVCITGRCVDLGASGVCSLTCTTAPCPPGMGCADLSDGRQVCLTRCDALTPCDGDPLLACLGPNAGPLGFALHAGTPPGELCAPRRCSTSDECAPAGTCRTDASGGHCVRRAT
jgi:PKD repeat protein